MYTPSVSNTKTEKFRKNLIYQFVVLIVPTIKGTIMNTTNHMQNLAFYAKILRILTENLYNMAKYLQD